MVRTQGRRLSQATLWNLNLSLREAPVEPASRWCRLFALLDFLSQTTLEKMVRSNWVSCQWRSIRFSCHLCSS